MSDNVLTSFLGNFDQYPFCVKIGQDEYKIGEGKPEFVVNFKKQVSMHSLLTSTSLALGEAYMNGDLEVEGDLYHALNHFLGQMGKFSTDEKALKKLIFTPMSRKNQQKEVQSHYDIGCGWGFLLIEAAKRYGIHGLGITLSNEQYKEFQHRIKEEHLEHLLEVKLMDYREMPRYGQPFDRVVSVGMVEHVGRGKYEEYMRCVKSVLKPGGIFLLHFISALKEYPGDAWIKKYIFPGGVVPSLREILQIAGDMRFYTVGVESLRRHYNKTLLCWNENFQKHRREVVEMFDERFARMWELFLCSCAATFMNGIIDLHQIIFTSDVNNELPMTKWY